MRTFFCSCGSRVFFDSTSCLACGLSVGWCPVCRTISGLQPDDSGAFTCANPACVATLSKCHNYAVEAVCNWCCTTGSFCDACQLNRTVPDLSVAGNRKRWLELETGKRRLLYTLDLLGLPYGADAEPPLAFSFMADAFPQGDGWSTPGSQDRVLTGHRDGLITINVREADPVERERVRVRQDEAHRTVLGHFRHEIGHYYWQMLVEGRCEPDCAQRFGDHRAVEYSDALQRYYAEGPPAEWQENYISAYASMHPWEDFAETFAGYLDIVSVLDTAFQAGISEVDPASADSSVLIERYVGLGIVFNEINRSRGLLDLVPEVFSPVIAGKLDYVQRLVRSAQVAAPPDSPPSR